MIFDRSISLKTMFERAPFTTVIIFINVAVFILGFVLSLFDIDVFYLGAIEHLHVTELNEYYRIITAAFIHSGFFHLFSNVIFGLLLLTSGLEKIIGGFKTGFIYFATMILSGIAVAFLSSPGVGTVGASGAIFGVLGAFLYLTFFRKDLIDPRDAQTIKTLIILNAVTTLLFPNISIIGHLSGLVFGFLVAFLTIPRDKSEYEIFH